MSFGPHTVTVVNRGWDGTTRDRHNNPVVAQLGTFALTGCWLQQLRSDEHLEARESTVTLWTLFAPPLGAGEAIGHIDHFRIQADTVGVEPDEGKTYATFEQDGEPDRLGHIDGNPHHFELILRRVQL